MKNATVFVAVFVVCLACFLAGVFLITGSGAVERSRPAAQDPTPERVAVESPAPEDPPLRPAPVRRVRRSAAAPSAERAVVTEYADQAAATPAAEEESRDDVRASSAIVDLKTIRSQLQLYKAQHNEQWPTDIERQMTKYTDADGNVSDTRSDQYRFGPYLLRLPNNPYTGVNEVTTVHRGLVRFFSSGDLRHGWWYNSATGEFRCDAPDNLIAPGGGKVNER